MKVNWNKLMAAVVAFSTLLMTSYFSWKTGYVQGYEKGINETKPIVIANYTKSILDFTCTVYPDRSMCCTPIFKFRNIRFAYKHPFQSNATQTYICHYNLTIQKFQKCEPLNISFH